MGIKQLVRNWLLKDHDGPSVVRSHGLHTGQATPPPDNPRALMAAYREWVFACVTKNAERIQATPLRLFAIRGTSGQLPTKVRKTPIKALGYDQRKDLENRNHLTKFFRGGKDVVEVLEHPFLTMWDKGNPFLTGAENQRMIAMHMDIVGDSYMLIEMDDFGPTQMFSLPPETIEIKTRPDNKGILWYEQRLHGSGGDTVKIPAELVMHTKHPDPRNILYGMSPLEAVGLAAILYHKYNIFEAALLDHDGVPGTLVTTKQPLGETQKRREERKWKERYGGARQAGKVGFFTGIERIDRIGFNQRDMAFTQGRKITREDIAGVYSVPISLLLADGSALAHSHDAEKHHARYAIQPRLILMEDQINRDIIPKYLGGENLFVAFDNPVPEDVVQNLERGKVMITTDGIFTKNEAREAMGEAPDPELDGEMIERAKPEPVIAPDPSAMPDIEMPEDEEDEEKHIHKAAPPAPKPFEDALKRLFKAQEKSILRGLSKGAVYNTKFVPNPDVVFDVDKWNAIFFDEIKPHLEVQLTAGANRGLEKIDADFVSFDISRPEVSDFIADYTFRFSRSTNDATNKLLQGIFTNANETGATLRDVTNSVQDLFGESERFKAARIARTETVRSRMAGEVEGWKQSGVVSSFYWQTSTSNPCPFCQETEAQFGKSATHLTFGDNFFDQGQGVSADDKVLSTDYTAIPHPPLHPNCGCELVPILVGES